MLSAEFINYKTYDMRTKKVIFLFIILNGLHSFGQDFNVITYNIRNNNPGNNDGENAWQYRKEQVCQLLRFHDAVIFGLQEVLIDQLQYFRHEFKDYNSVGVGRDDGKEAGEFSPIFYSSDLFQANDQGWFWLSEVLEQPGKGWDAACVRICTWIHLTHKSSGQRFYVFNTHFDHKGEIAKAKSVDLILKKIHEININQLPVIFMGDLNMTPEETPIIRLKSQLSDSREISKETPYGSVGTFNGFNLLSELKERIDYIFVNGKVQVLKYAVLSDSYNKRYYSDHLPVFVKISFKE